MTLDEYMTVHPTPWTVHPCGCKDVCWCRVIKSSGEVEDWLVGDGCINEVQANLLAAAPELLSVCELIRDKDRADTAPISGFLRDRIERAIAKARGASQS